MLGLGPIWALMIAPRLVPGWARARFGRTIIATNVALAVLLVGLCALVGWRAVVVVQLPTAMLAGAVGIWMFYVQHQFEDVYWERKEDWSYAEAALRGSSYLKLPSVLQFFTGSIGLHHVHHLSARIPNYHLQRAHDKNPVFHNVPRLNAWDGVRALKTQALRRGPRPDGRFPRGAHRARRSGDQRPAAPEPRLGAQSGEHGDRRKALEQVATRTRGRAQARESHEAGRLSARAGSLAPSCEVRGASAAAAIADEEPANTNCGLATQFPLEPVGGPQDVSRSSLGRHEVMAKSAS